MTINTKSNMNGSEYSNSNYNSDLNLFVQYATTNIPITITAAICSSIPNMSSKTTYEFAVRVGSGAFAGICLTVIDFFCAKKKYDLSPSLRLVRTGLHIATNSLSYSLLVNGPRSENNILFCSFLSGILYHRVITGYLNSQKTSFNYANSIGCVGAFAGGFTAAIVQELF